MNSSDRFTRGSSLAARLPFPLAAAMAALLAGHSASAAILTWDANGATPLQTDGAAAWLNTNQWWNGTTNVNWTSGDDANFGVGGAGGAVTLASPTTANSLAFNYFTGTYTLGTISQTLTINSGLTLNAGTGAVTFISPIKLGAAQTWTNNSTGLVTVNDGTNSVINTNGFTLTFKGGGPSQGKFTVAQGNGITGSGGIVVDNAYLDLRNPGVASINNYSGTTTVQNGGGILQNVTNISTNSNLILNGGVIDGYFNSGFTRALGTGANQIQITGGASGFGTNGNGAINLGGGSAQVVWGSTYFSPSSLMLGTPGSSAGTTTFANPIDLSGTTRTVLVNSSVGAGAISGIISNSSGTAGLTKTGVGGLSLTAANTYNGATSINGNNIFTSTSNTASGSITLSGANGRLINTSALNLSNGGTLAMTNATTETAVDRINSNAITVNNGGGITWTNTSGNSIVYAETVGAVTHNSGLFNVNLTTAQAGTGTSAQTLTFGGLTQSGTGAVAFSALTTGPQASGNKNMIVVTSSGTTSAGNIVGSWATAGTAANAQTDYATYTSDFVTPANIAASAQSAWSTDNTISTGTLNNTISALASGTLSATRNINSLRSTNNAVTVTASNANIALASHTLAVGDVVTFSAATIPTGLTAGTPYFVVATGIGTIQVSATLGGTAITPSTAGASVVAAGAVKLAAGINLGTTGILNGSAAVLNILTAGTGSVTLPTAAAGNLYITTGSGSIVNNAPIVNNGVGNALTLVKSGSGASLTTSNITSQGVLQLNGVNTYTGNTMINAGTLMIGNNANAASLGSGSYAGNITINAGAMLHIASTATQTLSGVISGDGALMKSTGGTLTLSGNNTYTGKTSIAPITTTGAGILSVSSFNSVVSGVIGSGMSAVTTPTTSSSLGAPTTAANGTIDVGGPLNIQGPATLRYTGSGETTDRVVNINYGSNTTRTLDASNANGLLKFTSAFTVSNLAQIAGSVILQGSGNAEIVQGLPFAVPALTKSGNGTWSLGGPVGNTGSFSISAGTLVATHPMALGAVIGNLATTGPTIAGSATLSLRNDSSVTFGLGGTGYNINNSASAATIDVDRVTGTGSNTLTVGNLTTTSTAAAWQLNFTGANGVSLSAGTLTTPLSTLAATHTISNTITGGGSLTLGSVFDAASTVAGPSLVFTGTGNTTVTGAITQTLATMTLTKSGAGTLTLSGANNYTGATAISGGVLQVATGSGTRCASAVAVNNTTGCIFGVRLAAANGQWASSSSLTVGGANSEVDIDYNATTPSTTISPAQVSTLTVSGVGTLKIIGTASSFINGSTYPLVTFTSGPAATSSYNGLALSMPSGMTGHLVTTSTQLQLVVDSGGTTPIVTPTISGVTASQSITYGTPTVTLSGTVSASGPVYPANSETVSVTINGNTQNTTTTGGAGGFSVNFPTSTISASVSPYTITYAYAGNGTTLAAAANNTSTALTVNKATPTIATAPSASAITYGQTLASSTLSGGSASTGGSFTFTTPATAPNAGTASQNVTFSPADTTNYNTAATTASVTVNQKALTIGSPTIADKPYDATTTAGAVTVGSLSGFVGSETVTATGVAADYSSANVGTYPSTVVTYTLANGTNSGLAANYSLAAGSASGTIVKANQTITFTLSSPVAKTVGTVTLSASATSSLPVTFGSLNPTLASVSGNTLTLLQGGSITVTADQAGDSNYNAAPQVSRPLIITGLTAVADTATRNTGSLNFKIPIATLLGNDYTVDNSGTVTTGSGLTLTGATAGSGNAVSFDATWVYYIPANPGDSAPLTFTYDISGGGNTSTATVTVSTVAAGTFTLDLVRVVTPAAYNSGTNTTSVTIEFAGVPNQNYQIEYATTNLNSWSGFTTYPTGGGSTFNATFTKTGDFATEWNDKMFFRAIR